VRHTFEGTFDLKKSILRDIEVWVAQKLQPQGSQPIRGTTFKVNDGEPIKSEDPVLMSRPLDEILRGTPAYSEEDRAMSIRIELFAEGEYNLLRKRRDTIMERVPYNPIGGEASDSTLIK
jgi:hypothetical protein